MPLAADPVVLLGDVGELEVDGEGADYADRVIGGQAMQQRLQLPFQGRDRQGPVLPVAQLLAERPHPLFRGEQLSAAQSLEGIAQQVAQQADVVAQGQDVVGILRPAAGARGGLP